MMVFLCSLTVCVCVPYVVCLLVLWFRVRTFGCIRFWEDTLKAAKAAFQSECDAVIEEHILSGVGEAAGLGTSEHEQWGHCQPSSASFCNATCST